MNGLRLFYTFNPLDQQAHILVSNGKIDQSGHVLDSSLDESQFALTKAEENTLLAHMDRQDHVSSCYKEDLGTISLIDIAKATQEASKTLHISQPMLLLRGSALMKLLKKRITNIYNTWSGLPIPTQFKPFLTSRSKNVNWVFCIDQIKKPTLMRQLVQEGLVKNLSENLKKQKMDPAIMALSLARKHKKAEESTPGSYLNETARCQGKNISTEDSKLAEKYIELCAFEHARNGQQIKTQVVYCERVLTRDAQPPIDLIFINTLKNTSTPINSLYIDLTPLLNGDSASKIVIGSTLGKAKRMQSICDKVLLNQTFDSSQPATHTDFVRQISHFTKGGRCYEEGCLEKSIKALKEEAKQQNLPWIRILADQLNSCLNYPHNYPTTRLIAFVFNASAILFWKNAAIKEEIQELWELALQKLPEPQTTSSSSIVSHPLLGLILQMVQDRNCLFSDLYSMIQVLAAVEQNRIPYNSRTIVCLPTQTDGHVFNQLFIQPQSPLDSHHLIYFFFPLDLAQSMNHLCSLNQQTKNSKKSNMLKCLFEAIVQAKECTFKFEASPLAKYYQDTRRQSDECLIECCKLMAIGEKQHGPWAF